MSMQNSESRQNLMTDTALDFSDAEVQQMLDNLDYFSPEEIAEIDKLAGELSTRKENTAAYNDLIAFCKLMMPDFIVGKHHRMLADMLMAIDGVSYH
jgi:replicative superfamily II helicase